MQENAGDQVVIGFTSAFMVGVECGMRCFFDQSQCGVKQNQCNHRLLSTLVRKLLYLVIKLLSKQARKYVS